VERVNELLDEALESADLGFADEPEYELGDLGSAFILCGSDAGAMIAVVREVLGAHYRLDSCEVLVTDAHDRSGDAQARQLA
jgi:hypothetical protein